MWGGKKGEWPGVIKKRDKGEGGGGRGSIWSVQGELDKGEKKRREEKGRSKIPRWPKGEGIRRYFGCKSKGIAAMSKRSILVLVALGKSIDLTTNF